MLRSVLLIILLQLSLICCSEGSLDTRSREEAAAKFLEEIEDTMSQKCYEATEAGWQYNINLNKENEQTKLKASLAFSTVAKELARNITSQFHWAAFRNESLQRQLMQLSILGTSALPEDKFKEYEDSINQMSAIYNTAKICSYRDRNNCELSLQPDLTEIMKTSRDEKELRYVWTQWRDNSGKKMRKIFEKYVELSNEMAHLNNFSDAGAFWLYNYETPTFKEDIEDLWQTLKPFYLQLHAYVRNRLAKVYGNDIVANNQPIPAHLLGNMWAQSWRNIYSLAEPFPGRQVLDVTQKMLQKQYTPEKIFQLSEEFFTSLDLMPMPERFWTDSVLEKIPGRDMACHASAWDMCNKKDFRIRQCTEVNMEHFVTAHHEMGHTQYQLQYKHQPFAFRNGANPGFHEAVGDTLVLSVRTPKHLKKIGLLEPSSNGDDYESTINYLLSVALEKIALLPFAYIVDKWRWDIFDGTIQSSDYNCHWWKLREEYQGLKPPQTRSEQDFDAGAKHHVASNVEYIRYFVSIVIQFQFHRSLCIAAGQYDPSDSSRPLHNCDIYQNRAAGEKFAAMLSMGSSKPWPEAMRAVTGQDKMDASAIREYFKPLEQWLIQKNEEEHSTVGWISEGGSCSRKYDGQTHSAARSAHKQCQQGFIPLFVIYIIRALFH